MRPTTKLRTTGVRTTGVRTTGLRTAIRGPRRGALLALALAAATALSAPTTAHAAPACETVTAAAPVRIAQLPDWAESIAVDARGRMFVTAYFSGRVYRIDAPGSAPVALTGPVGANGGIVVRPDGRLLVGTGNDIGHSLTGDLLPVSRLLEVDPDSGRISTYASGLGGIDGVALAPDGTVYTTTVGGRNIGRVTPDGRVDPAWARIPQPNGIAVSPDGGQVYVVQTTVAPALYRIPADDPAHPSRWIPAGLPDTLALPDGLTLDSQGRPLIATHAAGQIWRAEHGALCAVQSGLYLSTQITYGHGGHGFSAGRLFRSGADGAIYELPSGADPSGQ
ncbi:SMP-30/gluconolactonase/LRE family protein [Streptomyces sp. NBC_00083]|uniref:SMP-30/gluconolactonase/LRE family protein n=1 Tax=Streptomyces sp. NBC_00083 TaxID=2975647 RepID=UPI002256BFA6|nr:SMP-30/gluconolactonase/LRE family protein [Streptomyces sp. NBC_00083]MCX5384306.1 SMP-30/gluconolactonase/LRE family protein [Streptomyces sp. NBC_00083]